MRHSVAQEIERRFARAALRLGELRLPLELLGAGGCEGPAVFTLDVMHATRYGLPMAIKSFKCKDTEALYQGKRIRRWASVERAALRKLAQLDWSAVIGDLRAPPGNRLEALKDGRKGQYSIRINDQWRVCFVWTRDGAKDVEIVDYH